MASEPHSLSCSPPYRSINVTCGTCVGVIEKRCAHCFRLAKDMSHKPGCPLWNAAPARVGELPRVRSIDVRHEPNSGIVDLMTEAMRESDGIGLSAPQVGFVQRLSIIEPPGEQLTVLINPRIVEREGEQEELEGCLTLPGYRGHVHRSARVTVVVGLDDEVTIQGEGLLARILEHEVDHLDGVLFIDRLVPGRELWRIEAPKPLRQLFTT